MTIRQKKLRKLLLTFRKPSNLTFTTWRIILTESFVHLDNEKVLPARGFPTSCSYAFGRDREMRVRYVNIRIWTLHAKMPRTAIVLYFYHKWVSVRKIKDGDARMASCLLVCCDGGFLQHCSYLRIFLKCENTRYTWFSHYTTAENDKWSVVSSIHNLTNVQKKCVKR